ncbi:MAG: hypothetical protein ACRED8_03315 [Caulobacteraceae bacterium]
MSAKLAIAVFGLSVLSASPVLAGSAGPGWESRIGGNSAASAEAARNQDLATARHCQAHPEIMYTLAACRQARARHPEMFANSPSGSPDAP